MVWLRYKLDLLFLSILGDILQRNNYTQCCFRIRGRLASFQRDLRLFVHCHQQMQIRLTIQRQRLMNSQDLLRRDRTVIERQLNVDLEFYRFYCHYFRADLNLFGSISSRLAICEHFGSIFSRANLDSASRIVGAACEA